MNKKRMLKALVPMVFVVAMVVSAYAASEQDNRGPQQGPPPEAIKACEGKQVGDIVSFAGRGGESVEATCQSVENQIVAVPEGHRPQQ